MNFHLKNGLDKISVRLSEIGSYLHVERPVSTVWYDHRGSVGKYLCLLPIEKDLQTQIKAKIHENLNQDFTDRLPELKELLNPLLQLLRNGEYSLDFSHSDNSTFFDYRTSYDNFNKINKAQWYIVFGEPLNPNNAPQKIKEHQQHEIESKQNNTYTSNLVDFTTDNFYSYNDMAFIATQPASEIDHDRVAYFETKIKAGERPFVLMIRASFHGGYLLSENFILDGHHKLWAYRKCGITPSIACLTYHTNSREDVEFNIEDLIFSLYPWQVSHILEHWDEKDEYISEFLKNPKSKIHDFIKNGHYQEFYANGQLKHQAFYINDHIEGEAKWWFENGQLEKIEFYKEKIGVGEWKSWYSTGELEVIKFFDELGELHGRAVGYHKNGQLSMEHIAQHGKYIDGYSYNYWYENGQKSNELLYKNGICISAKYYNQEGELTSFSEFDPKTQRMVEKKIKK